PFRFVFFRGNETHGVFGQTLGCGFAFDVGGEAVFIRAAGGFLDSADGLEHGGHYAASRAGPHIMSARVTCASDARSVSFTSVHFFLVLQLRSNGHSARVPSVQPTIPMGPSTPSITPRMVICVAGRVSA